jgi:hypothetical protein
VAYQFALTGGYTTTPLDGVPSLAPNVDAPIDESMVITKKTESDIDLNVDTPVPVAFGGVVNASIVILKTVGGKIKARLTSADGTTQSIPVDSTFILISRSVPFTAIDLTRVPATPCQVRVYVGEVA